MCFPRGVCLNIDPFTLLCLVPLLGRTFWMRVPCMGHSSSSSYFWWVLPVYPFLIVTLPLISYVLNFYLYMNFLCTLLDSAFIYVNHCTSEVGRDLRMLPGPTAGLRGNTR